MTKLELEIIEAENKLKKLMARLVKQRGQRKIPCASCDKKHKISDIDLLSVYQWHDSYNNYEDSGYDFSGYGFKCSCGILNLLENELYYQLPYSARNKVKPIEEFMKLFKSSFRTNSRFEIPKRVFGFSSEYQFTYNYYVTDNLNLLPEEFQKRFQYELDRGAYAA